MVVRHPDTGVVLGSTPVSVFAGASLIPDWVHDRIFALYGNPRAWVISAVTGSGQLVGEAVQGGNCRPDIRVSAATGRIYVLQYGPGNGSYYGPIEQQLTAFDGATLQPLDDVHVTDFSSCDVGSLGVAAPPGAPARLAASLSGHDVTLSWTNVGDASGFVVDVGLAPGQTVVSVPVGLASSVTFGSAPPGLYFVRVRGSNLFGNSRPSNEVTIIVP